MLNPDVRTLFATDHLRVDYVQAGTAQADTVVCCFTAFNTPSLSGLGFAGPFVLNHGFDLVAVKNLRNDYYQTVPRALYAVLRQFLAQKGHARLATYGSSMGAYAAIHFAAPVGADAVLALSPRFDLAQTLANPWRRPQLAVTAVAPLRPADVAPGARYSLVYDSRTLDAGDADRYAAVIPAGQLARAPVAYAGHPVGEFLLAAGLLKTVALAGLRGERLPDLRARARLARPGNPAYLSNLSAHCCRRRKLGWAASLAARAIALAPRDWTHRLRAAQVAEAAGSLAEATGHAEAALAEAPDQPRVLLALARLAQKRGALAAALGYADLGLVLAPGHPALVQMCLRLRPEAAARQRS